MTPMSQEQRAAPDEALDMLFDVATQKRAVDIHEHLPTLYDLALSVRTVAEMGVRDGFGSTVAFLRAKPDLLTSYDINPCPNEDLLRRAAKTPWVFHQKSSLDVEIEPVDLLMIDTLHTYEQLSDELDRHHQNVRRYIALHDTISFGLRGEDGSPFGLWHAAIEFIASHPMDWCIARHHTNCNGLMVLERRLARPY